jgi:hypothetical protein
MARFFVWFAREVGHDTETAGRGSPLSEDVSVLRAYHTTSQAIVFRMRKATQRRSIWAEGCTTRLIEQVEPGRFNIED